MLFLMLSTLLSLTLQQNATQAWPTTLFSTEGNKTIELGEITGLTGLELNFWMWPQRSNNEDQSAMVLKFLSLIEVDYNVFTEASILKHGVAFKYGGKTQSGTLSLNNPPRWMNVNLRVQFGSYITMSVWQGTFNIETAPELTLTQTNPSAFSTITVDIQAMTPDLYVYLAEMRVFELDSSKSFGQYFKYYHGIFPQNLATDFTQARQYFTAFSNTLFLDIRNPQKNMSNPNAITFPVERCTYGQMVGPKTGGAGLPPQTMMTL